MFATSAEALSFIRNREIRFVDLMFVNLFGGSHHVTLPVGYFTERTFVEGVGVDGSSIPGFKKLESGDVCAIPDPTSMFLDPFAEDPTLVAMCDIVEADTKEPFASAPRVLARRAEEHLRASGIATRSVWGPELEYYLFDSVAHGSDAMRSGYVIGSHERSTWEGEVPAIRHQKGYYASRPADRLHDVRAETVRICEQVGVPVALHHHEVGAAGQVEFEVDFGGLLETGDRVVKAKLVAKMVARKHGLVATFMPKPLHAQAGTGLHFHQHLWDGERPLFYQQGTYADLSPIALGYVAGLLHHGGAVVAFTNPSTNSYRRLVPGFEAPVKAFFSLANRSAAVRVPRYATSPTQKRIEFRAPDATCNPYLATAAQLMAGLDGIRRNMDPTALGFGPIQGNVEKLPQAERDAIHSLPTSLDAAIRALEEDHAFLLEGGVFSEALVASMVDGLREQCRAIAERPHPYEFDLYLDT